MFNKINQKRIIYLNLIRWDRPAGWLLLLWPTLLTLWLAAGGFPGWHLLFVFIAGTILMRSAGCCINDFADANFDAKVMRTTQRPLVTGKISKTEALLLGAGLAFFAFILALTTNLYLVLWCIPALIVTILYPWSKRWFAMPQAVLGIAFSFGIPMAFATLSTNSWHWLGLADFLKSSGGVDAILLAIANLFLVLAYDTEYAMVDREDDLKIGIKTSAITLGSYDVIGVISFYFISILIFSKVLYQVISNYWLLLAIFLVTTQIIWHWQLIRKRQRQSCFKAFSTNHWIGFTWFIVVAIYFSI